MTKDQHLQILMPLSALESWSFADNHHLPDFLLDRLIEAVDILRQEILK